MNLTKLGDYEIVRRIGQGGMGAVYEGVNPNIGRRVAIKVLLPEYANQSDVVRRFWNEAKAVNAINHPGVVQVSEVGTATDGSLYLVMEYLEGQTLGERLAQSQGRLAEEEVITISWQLAGVLAAAHGKNVVHRDLKPANIMVVPDLAGPGGERVKLLDFGIAKLGIEHLRGEDVKTRTGQMLGTAAYMSPEQFMATQSIDGQSDVYSLGVVMYRLLSGILPFTSTNGQMALGMLHLTEPPPPLAEKAQGTSAWLIDLVHRMMSKKAAQRPTMAQVMSELEEHLPLRPQSRSLRAVSNPGRAPPSQEATKLVQDTALVRAEPQSIGAMKTAPPDATALLQPAPADGHNVPDMGTITGATGQSTAFSGRFGGRLVVYLALGFAVLVTSSTGLYLLIQGRLNRPTAAAVSSPLSATPANAEHKAAGEASPPAEPVAKNRAGATPSPKEQAAKTIAPAETGQDSGTRPGRGKSSRLPSSTKSAERKKDDKPRRISKPPPTPILD